MFSKDFLRDLYAHMEWADASVWAAIGAPGPSDEYLHDTLYHLHATQRAFMNFWSDREIERPDPKKFADLASIRSWSRSFYIEAGVFLAALKPEDLTKVAVVPWSRFIDRAIGTKAEATLLGETLFQVAIHSAYHRGQVNRRFRELGGEPPPVDYIAWLWRGRPSPPWQDAAPS